MSKKISQLTEVSTNSTSDVFVCNQSGDTKKTTLQKIADAIFGSKTDNNLPHYTGTPSQGSTAEAIANVVKYADAVIGNVTIGANGYVDISSNANIPTTPTGYTVLGALVKNIDSVSTKDFGIIVFCPQSNEFWVGGSPNSTVNNLQIRIIYIKS